MLPRFTTATVTCTLIFALACDRGAERATPIAEVGTSRAPSASAAAPSLRRPAPQRIFTLESSAYAATLALDDEAPYLLTSDAAYRLVPGAPAERWALDLGISPVLAGEALVYWSKGALWQVPKHGGEPRLLARVSRQPLRIASSGERVVWLDHAEDGRDTIWTLAGSEPRLLASPEGAVVTLVADAKRVFYVERDGARGFRLGAVPVTGGPVRHSGREVGRAPSMLAVSGDVYLYDGSRQVRRLSPDLDRDRVVARERICSPLAVAEHVYCAEPGLLVEVPLDGSRPRALTEGRMDGAISAIVASATRVAWLVDLGPGRLAVETLSLKEPVVRAAP